MMAAVGPLNAPQSVLTGEPAKWSAVALLNDRFSNRPFGVKHFQTIHLGSFDVAHGLALLFGIGT